MIKNAIYKAYNPDDLNLPKAMVEIYKNSLDDLEQQILEELGWGDAYQQAHLLSLLHTEIPKLYNMLTDTGFLNPPYEIPNLSVSLRPELS